MTPADIIYHRRLAVLEHAARCANVSEACRAAGVSRTRYYEWKKLADSYGPEALRPKGRRAPQLPNATPTQVIEQLFTLAVLEPTLGARRLADRLADMGWPIAGSTAQRYLTEAGLRTRRARIARAALVAAAAGGIVTDAAREAEPMGFCHVSAGPGELLSVDSFYIGNLKGVGRVYQLTAVDVFTRWATVAIIVGTPTGAVTARFVDPAGPPLAPPRLPASGRDHRQRSRVHRRRLRCCAGGQERPSREDPGPLPQPQRGGRTLPRDHPPGVLAAGVPPPALHQPPTAPGRC